ncbi:MAG: transposase [Kiloniellaceae bacterium]|nr:transposase [Kiloniellaceae bacterium]
MVDAILYQARTGCSWRQLPGDLPPWATVYDYFALWSADGAVDRLHDRLRNTVRDADGLALSSRNALLDDEQRSRAPAIHRILTAVAQRLTASDGPAAPLLAWGRAELQRAGVERLDYLDLRAGDNLEELIRADRPARLFVAGWMGSVRLIDNIAVPPRAESLFLERAGGTSTPR